MEYYIIPAKEVEVGDIVFTNNGDGKGIQFCGRVLQKTDPSPHPMITEWTAKVLVDDGQNAVGSETILGFRHSTMVGVVRKGAPQG